jgi:surface protein
MKTKLLIGLATVLLLTACSNDELVRVNIDSTNDIGFSTFVNKSTRATDITNSNLGDFNFAVNGYTKGTATDAVWQPIFLNEEVSKDGNDGWKYDNLQYWEDGNAYHFHAIAPYGVEEAKDSLEIQRDVKHWEYVENKTDYSKAKITFINIKKGSNYYEAAGEQDLIYAYQYAEGKAKGKNEKVQFDFKHLLSRVKFQFKGAASNPASVKIKVTEVTFKGTYSDGSIEIEAGNDAAWSLGSTTELPFGYAGTTDADGNFSEDALSSTVSEIETAHKYVIPDINSSIRYKVSFKCEIEADVNGGVPKIYTVISDDYDLPAVQMKEGFSYVYQITLDASLDANNNLIKPILFNVAEVIDWDDYKTLEKQNYVIEFITPTSTTSATTILGSLFLRNNKDEVKEIYIDDDETPIAPTVSYKFDNLKEHKVKIVLNKDFTSAQYMFSYCGATSFDFTNFDTSKVTDMSYMFAACSSLTSLNLSTFDTSKVENMTSMFMYCIKLTELDFTPFEKFKTGNVKDMSMMFNNCSALTKLNLSSFDTSKVTNVGSMFQSCTMLQEVRMCGGLNKDVTVINMFKDAGVGLQCTLYYKNGSTLDYTPITKCGNTQYWPTNWTAEAITD